MWLAIFWRAYIHFSLVRVADLNSVLRANFGGLTFTFHWSELQTLNSVLRAIFGAYKNRDELHFTSVLSFLAVRNVSVLLVQFQIVTLHCVWHPS